MFLSVLETFFEALASCAAFLSPPRQDIASLTYPDGFHQAQAVWLCETRQDGFSTPSPCCEEKYLFRGLSGKHHCSWRGCF